MAIFGNLKDMPFPDLVGMLGRRSGVLELFHLPGRRAALSLALEGGKVMWVREGNHYLDPLEARAAIGHLFALKEGAFEFASGTPPPPPEGKALGWPLERLLLSLTTVADEMEAYAPYLPDAKTRFQAASLDAWLEEPLWSFWERAKPLLERGACAEELSQRLGFPLDQTRYYLHKLRLAGKVAPVRAYQEKGVDEEKKSLFRRLLASLFGGKR